MLTIRPWPYRTLCLLIVGGHGPALKDTAVQRSSPYIPGDDREASSSPEVENTGEMLARTGKSIARTGEMLDLLGSWGRDGGELA